MLSFKTLVAFGDGFSSQCGTLRNTQTNSLDINLRSWTDFQSGLHGNPIFTDCAPNSGLNYLNYLTNCTRDGIDPLTCPIRLIDLAAADIRAENQSTTQTGKLASISSQLDNWSLHVKPAFPFHADETLVSLFYGSRELTLLEGKSVDDAYETEVKVLERMEVLEQSIGTLYRDGLRHFLIFNLFSNSTAASSLTNEWNRLLNRYVSTFQLDKSGSKVYLMDTNRVYNDFLAVPEQYEFTYTSEGCSDAKSKQSTVDCSDTSEYLLLDETHWTPKAHKHLATAVQKMMHEQTLLSSAVDQGIVDNTGLGAVKETYGKLKTTVSENRVAVATILFLPLLVILAFLIIPLTRRRGASILRSLKIGRRGGRVYAQVPVHERVRDVIELQGSSNPPGEARDAVNRGRTESIPRDDFDI